MMGMSDMGLKLDGVVGSPDLCMGFTSDCFHWSGTSLFTPLCRAMRRELADDACSSEYHGYITLGNQVIKSRPVKLL